MRRGAIDLDNCEDEPIHIPGSIQPHGTLIAFDDSFTLRAVSENVTDLVDRPAIETIGAPLSSVVGEEAADAIAALAPSAHHGRIDDWTVHIAGRAMTAALFVSTGWYVLELEHVGSTASLKLPAIRAATMELNGAVSVMTVADAAARAVRQLTGFDRVMVYRFDPDWHGEVIAEQKRDDLNTFMGLHYPSTDIPAQARQLYRRNWLRLIPDIHYSPVDIVPDDITDAGDPIDLSDSTIRSVSPIHVEYLANMGVTASMSVSLIVEGNLWGLIACHHYSGPHRPSPEARSGAEYLGQLASVRLRECERNDERRRSTELVELANSLGDLLASDHAIHTTLSEAESAVLKLADATGAMISLGGDRIRLGVLPPDDALQAALTQWPSDAEWFVCDRAAALVPEMAGHADIASGILAIPIADDHRDLAVWVRPEHVELIDWAGDPYSKEVQSERPGARLSPRRSFERWRELTRGRSVPWGNAEVQAAQRLTRHLLASKLRRDREVLALADDLTRIMLPASLPAVPGFEVDAHYAPDGQGRVGGDWYDVIGFGDRTAFVVGDVTGHGLRAAATMTQARNALRAYLADDDDPTEAVIRLDRLMRGTLPGEMLTLLVGVLAHGTSTITLCSAGHPPPLLVAGDAVEFLPVATNHLLGVFEERYEAHRVTLSGGDTLVLFSDGLVELRGKSLDTGLAMMRTEAARLGTHPMPGWTRHLADLMSGPERRDDLTILAVRRRD